MDQDDLAVTEEEAGAALAAGLAEVLAREADVLRRADFAALPALLAEKERLAEELACAPRLRDAETVRQLQASATRNAMLLTAAGDGLRAACDQIRALTAPPVPLQTYDGAGRRAPMAAARPGTERRA